MRARFDGEKDASDASKSVRAEERASTAELDAGVIMCARSSCELESARTDFMMTHWREMMTGCKTNEKTLHQKNVYWSV